MEVRYTLTLDEYVAFCVHAYRKAGTGRRAHLFTSVVCPILCIAIAVALILLDGKDVATPAISLTAAGTSLAVFYPIIYWWLIRRGIRAFAEKAGTQGITGPITLILSDESLTEITTATRSEVKWADMKGIEVVGDRTYIYITGLSASILPRSGFDTGEQYEAVRDFAMRKLADKVS